MAALGRCGGGNIFLGEVILGAVGLCVGDLGSLYHCPRDLGHTEAMIYKA